MAYDDGELRRRVRRAAESIGVPERPLRRGARPIPILAGAAAAAVVLVLAVAAGQYLGGRRDLPAAVGSASATPSATSSASATASTTPEATATPTPTARPTSDATVAKYIVPLVASWRPATTSVVVVERSQSGNAPNEQTIVAVPPDGSAPTKLARLVDVSVQHLRRDGGALAFMAMIDQQTTRIAVWNLGGDGTMRWLTPPEPGVRQSNPVWSYDGQTVYFGKSTDAGDQGLFQVNAGGGTEKQIHAPVRAPLISIPLQATGDGLLVWGAGYEGASVEVLDLATGKEYSAGTTGIVAVREGTGPRFLVAQGGGTFCCSNPILWDHLTGQKRNLFANPAQIVGFDWAPANVRIVGAVRASPTAPLHLELTDVNGETPKPIAGTDNAQWPLWLSPGIAYLYAASPTDVPVTELRIVDPGSGTVRTLYRAASGATLFQYGTVSP